MNQNQEKSVLLGHLNEQKHPTLREKRLQLLLDEYLFIRDNLPKDGSNSILSKLTLHLQEELNRHLIEIPGRVSAEADEEMKLPEIENLISAIGTQQNLQDQQKAMRTLLEIMLANKTVVELFIRANGPSRIFELLGEPPKAHILHFLSAISSFDNARPIMREIIPPQKLLKLLPSSDSTVAQDAALILSNYFYDQEGRASVNISEVLHPLFKVLTLYNTTNSSSGPLNTTLIVNGLRCLANLAIDGEFRSGISVTSPLVDLLVTMLEYGTPELQTPVAGVLSNLASAELVRPDCLDILISYLSSPIYAIAANSARTIANFASFQVESHDDLFRKDDRLTESLLKLLRSPQVSVQEEAIRAFGQLLARDLINDSNILLSILNEMKQFITLESETYNESLATQAAWCLAHMAHWRPDIRLAICQTVPLSSSSPLSSNASNPVFNGFLEDIALLLTDGDPEARLPALWTLSGVSECEASWTRFRDCDVIKPLVSLLFAKDENISLPASKALFNLSKDGKNKQLIQNLFTKLALKDPSIVSL